MSKNNCIEKTYRVAFATGSRADYGIVRHYLELLKSDSRVNLEILVTGALLSSEYGHQIDLIYADNFKIGAEITIPLASSSNAGIIHSMAKALDQFGTLFEDKRYDLLIILGDRYEMLSVAIAAAMQRIPILHIHGGEATYGNYDEFIRHSITKMSLFHFTATEEYRKRVIQLGENPNHVYYLGALGAENCQEMDEKNIPADIKALKNRVYYVVLFHPETLTGASILEQINELLAAVQDISDAFPVFIGSNADTHSNIIREKVHEFVKNHTFSQYYENLHTDAYHYLLQNSICLIGNSSSGIIEAPSLGIYTINIGERQAGRVRGNSIIDVACKAQSITNAYYEIRMKKRNEITNPYYVEGSKYKYYGKTMEILEAIVLGEGSHTKAFFDIAYKDYITDRSYEYAE